MCYVFIPDGVSGVDRHVDNFGYEQCVGVELGVGVKVPGTLGQLDLHSGHTRVVGRKVRPLFVLVRKEAEMSGRASAILLIHYSDNLLESVCMCVCVLNPN